MTPITATDALTFMSAGWYITPIIIFIYIFARALD